MTGRRTVLWGAVVWVGVVAVVGVLVWVIVSRAGDGLSGARELTPSTPVQLPTERGSTAGDGDGRPTREPRASRSPRPERPSSTSSPSTPAPSSPAGSPTTDGSGSPGAGAGREPQRGTWQGRGGVVTTECRGSQIRLVAAQPDSGYEVEVDDRGPDRVRVELERSDGDRRVRVEAGCSDGRPAYEVDAD